MQYKSNFLQGLKEQFTPRLSPQFAFVRYMKAYNAPPDIAKEIKVESFGEYADIMKSKGSGAAYMDKYRTMGLGGEVLTLKLPQISNFQIAHEVGHWSWYRLSDSEREKFTNELDAFANIPEDKVPERYYPLWRHLQGKPWPLTLYGEQKWKEMPKEAYPEIYAYASGNVENIPPRLTRYYTRLFKESRWLD